MDTPLVQQRLQLAALLRVDPKQVRQRVKSDAFDYASGSNRDITLDIPKGFFYAITSIEVEGYPKDSAGNYLMGERKSRAPIDTVSLKLTHKGTQSIVQADYHALTEQCLYVFGPGRLTLNVAYASIGAAVAQRLYVKVMGWMVPLGVSGGDAESTGGGAVPVELGESPDAPVEAGG